ncbi:MAG: sulfotransferase domain-containing protein [Desulfovibrio sp.]|nr:sulfotransferase domain-containing protein [Desulfovibrio sp.]
MTRALPVFGVDIGRQHLARADNPRGFFEHPQFVAINERILSAFGADWKSFKTLPMPHFSSLLAGETGLMARAFLQNYCPQDSLRGLKDPRASRLLPFWRPLCAALNISLTILVLLRNPANVAHSLAKRDGLAYPWACALWKQYVCEALLYSHTLPRLLVSYEQLIERPRSELMRVARFLGQPFHEQAYQTFAENFLDPALCHHREKKIGSDPCQLLYARLLPLTEGLEHHQLDSPRFQRALFSALEERV